VVNGGSYAFTVSFGFSLRFLHLGSASSFSFNELLSLDILGICDNLADLPMAK
jgi:hypothetical protein